jgi:hypothetical protein
MSKLSHQAMSAAVGGSLIREDIMDQIWLLQYEALPFSDIIGRGTHTNRKAEFVTDELAAASTANAVVEGADIVQNDTKIGTRLGNYTQIAVKAVAITDTAEAADSVGAMGRMMSQIKNRQKELRQDVEAQMLSNQASVAGDANTVAGISAGLGAQIKTHISLGATGAAGGYNTTTGLFVATTPGTKRAISESVVRDLLQGVYENGGKTTVAMGRPAVIRLMSEYLFTGTARVATLQSNKEQKGDGQALTAYGSVNVFVTDFGQTIELRDNPFQPVEAAGQSTLYLLDPTKIKQSLMRGYQVEDLAKNGLSDRKMMSVQYSLLVLNEKHQGAYYAIDETAAMVA